MVNAAKRMRALQKKIFPIRNSPGSVTLPAGPGPVLKSIYLRVPTGTYFPFGFFVGARDFWRKELQRLKYYNPTLAIKVETVRTGQNEPFYMSLEYESSDQTALANLKREPLPKPLIKLKRSTMEPKPTKEDRENLSAEELLEKKRRYYEKEYLLLKGPDSLESKVDKIKTEAPSIWDQLARQAMFKNQPTPKVDSIKSVHLTPDIVKHAPKDEIVVKAQVAADPSMPQSSTPPETTFSRTITTPIAGVRHNELWNWIRRMQDLPDHHSPEREEQEAQHKLRIFTAQAEKDKKGVSMGIQAMKAEQGALKQARELSDRMQADNV